MHTNMWCCFSYIFARNNKIKLKKILFICAILCIVYLVVVYKSTSNINISNICGYTIELQFKDYYYIVLLIINSIFVIKGIELFNKTLFKQTRCYINNNIFLYYINISDFNFNKSRFCMA